MRNKPHDGRHLGMDPEKTSVMGYKTLFDASRIHHSNSGLQITNDTYINDYFVLLFDLTPERGVSERHISLPDNGNNRVE